MQSPVKFPESFSELNALFQPTDKSEKLVIAADEAVRCNETERAETLYRQALEDYPANFDALAGLEYLQSTQRKTNDRYDWGSQNVTGDTQRARQQNAELNIREFQKKRRTLKSLPKMCLVELTTRCNFSCYHCSRSYEPCEQRDIDQETMEKIEAQLLPTLNWMTVTGFGEQTIARKYPALMKSLVANGIDIHFSTNTSTLNPAHLMALIKHNANVILSIDGTSRKTFEKIRSGGHWEKLLRSLFLIKRLRTIYPGRSLFRITFVLMRINIHELPDMIRLIDFFQLDDLTAQDYLPCGDPEADTQTLRNDPVRGNQFIDEARILADKLSIKALIPPHYELNSTTADNGVLAKLQASGQLFPTPGRYPMRCFQPWSHPCVQANGDVTPCCNSTRPMGSLKKQEFKTIWNGWRFRLFRYLVDSGLPPPECRICNVIDGINAGNPGNTIKQEGILIKALYYIARKTRI